MWMSVSYLKNLVHLFRNALTRMDRFIALVNLVTMAMHIETAAKCLQPNQKTSRSQGILERLTRSRLIVPPIHSVDPGGDAINSPDFVWILAVIQPDHCVYGALQMPFVYT
jgi:hypothetical protein